MDITDFKLRAHRICDRWYFKTTETDLEMWERPFVRGPGFEKDYKALVIPLEILCRGNTSSEYLTQKLQGLKWNHEMRMRGKQMEQLDGMTQRNAQRKANVKKDFQRTTKDFYRDSRKLFKKLGEETHGSDTRSHLIAKSGQGENWEDAKRKFWDKVEKRQGVA